VIEDDLHPPAASGRTFFNFVSITAFNRPLTESGLYTQEDHAGPRLPGSRRFRPVLRERPVDVPSCPFGVDQCGFSLQWGEGSY
jgi:hypothetical protein